MAISLSSNYVGKASSGYISAAIFSAPTVAGNKVKVMPGVKYKLNVRKADWSTNLIQAASCDYNSQGTLTLSESVLEVSSLMTNQTICKSTMENSFMADEMRAGANNTDFTTDFTTYVIDSMMSKIGEALEYNIWSGNLPSAYSGSTTTGYSSFNGFIYTLNAGSPVTQTGFVISDTNVVSALTLTYLKVPAKARTPRLTFYVSPNTAAYYQLAQAGKSLERYTDGTRALNFMGYDIAVSHGIPDNHIIAGDSENFFVGTDLLDDANQVQTIDMTPIDGSMNVRMVARYKFGVQIGYTNEVAWFRP